MRLIIRIGLLFIVLLLISWCILNGRHTFLFFLAPLLILQIIDFYQYNIRIRQEVEEFSQAIHYRDFSRYFSTPRKGSSSDILRIRQSHNTILDTLRQLSAEKEMQYLYLQKILELVDTGILSYETESGQMVWMNEAVKNMLQIPFLKTIDSLQKRNPELYQEIVSLPAGAHKLISISQDNRKYKSLINLSMFQVEQKTYRLVALQNVNDTLDEAEVRAWQKLLSVMTHEIMNSIAPISSLADTLKVQLTEETMRQHIDTEQLEDIHLSIDTIRRRSQGLLRFAQTYRNLNKISNPNLSHVHARDLFENLQLLLGLTMEQKNIEFTCILPDTMLSLNIDTNLIEQALINLLTNAIEAVKEVPEPKITLAAFKNNSDKIILKISDNGTGIPPELLERIFIPFFSTRKNGSGIGLSLCQQIMLLHNGSIQVHSVVGQGSVFTLHF